jgi:hypothetical protein
VFDASGITSSGMGTPKKLQAIAVDKSVCNTPHELGVDHGSGDFFLTCVDDPNSGFQKYSLGA